MKDKAAKEAAEKKKKEEKEACIKDKLAKLNPYDGLIHNEDGTTEFLEGGIVGGANAGLWIATKAHHTT